MIITHTEVPLTRNQKLIVVPIGDIHYNASSCDQDRFAETVKWIAETSKRPDRKVVTILMGDYLDTFSRSERARLSFGTGLHESTHEWFEKQVQTNILELYNAIKPIKHTIGCVLAGNHTYKFQERAMKSLVGKTSDMYLAELLEAPFMGMCGVYVLNLASGSARFPFKIFMHHGFGSSSSKPSSVKQLLDLRAKFPAMNLYIMGHNHVKICTTQEGIDVRFNNKSGEWRMVSLVQGFLRSASFLKGYVEGEVVDGYSGSYAEEKCLAPASLGVVSANIRLKVNKDTKQADGYVLHVQE